MRLEDQSQGDTPRRAQGFDLEDEVGPRARLDMMSHGDHAVHDVRPGHGQLDLEPRHLVATAGCYPRLLPRVLDVEAADRVLSRAEHASMS